jgi:hypothetical protein
MPDGRRLHGDDRSVSEVVGYVLVFALIISTVGLVSIGGLPALDSARESEQLNNAERAFDVLSSNLEEVYERGAPSRATELNAQDAAIKTGDPVTFNVSIEKDGNVSYVEAEINPVVYTGLGETEFVYEAGAVIRDQSDTSVMLREPPFEFGGERAFVTLVRTFSDTDRSIEGGTVLVRAESAQRSVEIAELSGKEVSQINITVADSPRQDAWERYFEEEAGLNCSVSDGLDCGTSDSVEEMFVTLQEIRISLEV